MEPKTDDPTCTSRRRVGLGRGGRHPNLRSSKPLSRSAQILFRGAGGVPRREESSPQVTSVGHPGEKLYHGMSFTAAYCKPPVRCDTPTPSPILPALRRGSTSQEKGSAVPRPRQFSDIGPPRSSIGGSISCASRGRWVKELLNNPGARSVALLSRALQCNGPSGDASRLID